jgi:undecaprenyl-diphosphatase
VRPEPETAEGPLRYDAPADPLVVPLRPRHAFTAASVLAHTGHGDVFWYTVATVVGGSRVYVRMHHASDVIAGALMGIALGRVARHWFDPPGR